MDNRLKKAKEIDLVFKTGTPIYSKSLTILYLESDQTKVAYCVSKKHGKSVMRNRIKRLLRESFRKHIPFLNKNYKIVIIPKVSSDYSFETFNKEIDCLLKKKGLI